MPRINKVVVIGLDGGTLDMIRPMVRQGRLPHIGRLMMQGASGTLLSTPIPITPQAWASFMTGKNPGKHGVLNFFHREQGENGRNEIRFVSSKSIRAFTLWQILSQRGKKSIVVNVPVTYPVYEINGVLVSGFLTPPSREDFVYPTELKERIREHVGDYRVDAHPSEYYQWNDIEEKLEHHFHVEEKRRDLGLYLMREHPWDLFVIVFSITDKIGHFCWQFMHEKSVDSERLAAYVYRAYERVDAYIGELVSLLDEETAVLLVSDHGFGLERGRFFTNRWLLDNGFLHLRKTTLSNLPELYTFQVPPVSIDRILSKLRLNAVRPYLAQRLLEKRVRVPKIFRRPSGDVVDWDKTVAFAENYAIRINVKGRENHGIVEPGKDYEEVRRAIMDKLKEIRDPQTGERMVEEINRREELFWGSRIEEAPDIRFVFKGLEYVPNDSFAFKRQWVFRKRGTHRMEGIFVACGPGVRPGFEVPNAKIQDVAPTILHLLREPIPDDMDGRVLTECLEDGHLLENPIRSERAREFHEDSHQERDDYTDGEMEEIKNGLRALGYFS